MFVCESCNCITNEGRREWIRSNQKSRMLSPKCGTKMADCGKLFMGVSTSLQMLWGLVRSDTVQRNALIQGCWDNTNTKCEAESGTNNRNVDASESELKTPDQNIAELIQTAGAANKALETALENQRSGSG